MTTLKVGIVGAGFAGLVCAKELTASGATVTLFDKGRFPGGRLASRQRDDNWFDYGAQYFTARDPRFVEFLLPLIETGAVSVWDGKFAKFSDGKLSLDSPAHPRYVGVPHMRSLADAELNLSDCRLRHRVNTVKRENNKWTIAGMIESSGRIESAGKIESGGKIEGSDSTEAFSYSNFDCLVLNQPPEQAQALQPHAELGTINLLPCIALLLTFEKPLNLDFDGITLSDEVISWAARDSSKPGRPPGERWVLHATPNWSKENFELDPAAIQILLTERFSKLFDITLPTITFVKLHKWRYALPVVSSDRGFLSVPEKLLVYCGDWCAAPRVEGAYLSGIAAAAELSRLVSS